MATKTLTKAELVAALADRSGTEKATVSKLLDALSDVVTDTVKDGAAVNLPGIGKIAARDRPERQVRNPATQEVRTAPADRVAKVTVAKALNEALNG